MNLQNILRERRKHKAILDYLERLGPALARMYGKSDLYKPQEILSAINEKGMSRDDSRYALALYSSREDFDAYCAANDLDDAYFDIRIEIADLHFGGNAGFMPIDVELVHDHLVRHRNPDGSEAAKYFYASDQGADYYRKHNHDGKDQG